MNATQGYEPALGDAFGLGLLDYLENGTDARVLVLERDDGLVEVDDRAGYFAETPWLIAEAVVPERAGHRVLDIGAGAGRHCLTLQDGGHHVVALDVSAGAIEVCRRRGVRETFEGTVFEFPAADYGRFNTFLLCGQNYGLLESPSHAPRFLRTLAELAEPGAEIIGTCLDPIAPGADELHLGYHQLNRERGRLPGQLRLRYRWTNVATPWFDYLFVPVDELAAYADEAGWRLIEHQPGPGPYLAILQLT